MKSLRCAVVAAALLVLNGLAVAGGPGESKVSLKIDATSMEQALSEFARQTGLQLVFPAEEVTQGLAAPRLTGSFTPQAALSQLLANSGLYYQFINENTVAIRAVRPADSEAGKKISGGGLRGSGRGDVGLRLAHAGEAARADGQAEDKSSAAAEGARKSAEDRKDVSEIIVTATKRAQSVQDVPISIAVLTNEDIERRGLVGAADYMRGIPGASQVEAGYGGQLIIIRGMESQSRAQNYYSGPTTATYFGEAPTTNSAGLIGGSNVDIKLVDIERVEVLRGPQGTAFGNSSMGGAVRTIPVAPKLDRFEGKLGAGYSATSGTGGDNTMFQAVGNLPIVADKLAVRAVAYRFSDSGYYRNRAGSDTAFQARIIGGAGGFAADENEVGAYRAFGGRIAALYQASERLRFTLSYLKQKTETDGWAAATTGEFEQSLLQVAPEHVNRGQKEGLSDTHIGIANGVMEYDFGWADLVGTYSDIRSGTLLAFPITLFLTPYAYSIERDLNHREHVGELRLATKLNGAWNFLAGLYVEKQHDYYPSESLWHGDPAASVLTGNNWSIDERELKQKAAFGEVSWTFLGNFTLTGGLRAFDYTRTILQEAARSKGAAFNTVTFGETDASGTTGRLNLSYKIGENALVYAGWAQGFRFGKPQPPQNNPLCDLNNDGVYDGTNITLASSGVLNADSVDSYEIGGKFASPGRRVMMDAAVFRMDWDKIPVAQILPCLSAVTMNGGTARSEGVELQASFQLTDAFSVSSGGSWIDATLTQDVPAFGAIAGDRLPGSPKVNANLGAQYQFNIAGHTAFVRTDAIYVGPFYNDLRGPRLANDRAGDYVKLDASARMVMDHMYIDLYVHNVTDEDAFSFRGAGPYSEFFGFRLRPRTVGLQLGYDF